ncbi:MAG: hypothetical protein K2X34_01520 [Hyphomonadaceae bacterium]|nr:hypothetical protein [Hyphomonadaceae bacterium]
MLDPVGDSDAEVRIGADLLKASDLTKAELREIETWLSSFLADPAIVTADIKGLLNREMGYSPFDLSGRDLLEAVARELRKLT